MTLINLKAEMSKEEITKIALNNLTIVMDDNKEHFKNYLKNKLKIMKAVAFLPDEFFLTIGVSRDEWIKEL